MTAILFELLLKQNFNSKSFSQKLSYIIVMFKLLLRLITFCNHYFIMPVMKKYFFILFMLFTCTITLHAQSFMNNIDGRKTFSLNGKWQYIVDWYNRGTGMGIYKDKKAEKPTEFMEYAFTDQVMNVPGDWNSQDPHLFYYENNVWYKKEFTYQTQTNKRYFLYFGAVNYQSDIYLNGRLLGSHEGGFTPFQFEITDSLKTGINKLIVKVNSQRKEDGIPAMNYDWWNYGGITRDVTIIETPVSYIKDYFVQLKKGSNNEINAWVKIDGINKNKQVTLHIPELKIDKVLNPDTTGYAAVSINADVKLWSPETPKQYLISLTTDQETITEKVGFRNIEVKGTDIILNGKSIFLKGVNFHEEVPQRMARATSVEDSRQLLQWAKELGCNFVRLTHYPQSEHTIRMAEEMGIMLWEEIPLWQGIAFDNPVILNKAETMLREMISRDKNHCSIIIWSIANETKQSPDRNKVLANMAGICRSLDNTRLVSSALYQFKIEGNTITIDDPLCNSLDVIGTNRYMGWYQPWPAEPGNVKFITAFQKPIIMSEFGGESKYGQHGTADSAGFWNEEFQEKLYKDNLKMMSGITNLRGTCPWVLADFRAPNRMNLQFQYGWNRKGLLSDKGQKKKAWYVMKAFYETK